MSSDRDQHEELLREFDRYDNLHTTNLINQDTVIVQVSGGLLAVLAAFGSSLLQSNKTLSYIVLVALSLTIMAVIFGYFFSNKFFTSAKSKLNQNYEQGINPLTKGIDEILETKIGDFLNHFQFVSFFLGISFFAILLINYLGGL